MVSVVDDRAFSSFFKTVHDANVYASGLSDVLDLSNSMQRERELRH